MHICEVFFNFRKPLISYHQYFRNCLISFSRKITFEFVKEFLRILRYRYIKKCRHIEKNSETRRKTLSIAIWLHLHRKNRRLLDRAVNSNYMIRERLPSQQIMKRNSQKAHKGMDSLIWCDWRGIKRDYVYISGNASGSVIRHWFVFDEFI